MKILVIFPTHTEAQCFHHEQVDVAIGGVGLSATAYNTSRLITEHKPDWLILAGIAGAYQNASLAINDVVLVSEEYEADLGFFTPRGFTHLSELDIAMDFSIPKQWTCPYVDAITDFTPVRSNSMNAAMAPFVRTTDIQIENMEGAAFFQVCLAEQQKFLEIRCISNYVKIDDETWDMAGSLQSLSRALDRVITQLLASTT